MGNTSDNIIDETAPVTEPERQYYYIDRCRELIAAKEKEAGRKLTCGIFTFGCQMNFHDSEKIKAVLEKIGFEPTDSEDADMVLYNTCTVRENANDRVYGRLGQLKAVKKKREGNMLIALCGCMMQEQHVVSRISSSYKFVDIVFGTHNIYKLAELLYERLVSGSQIIDIWEEARDIVEDMPSDRKYSFKAGVNIMYGCNNFCSYCIVPYVRGRERSRRPEDIVKEVERYVADGAKEVMLLGQNVNSYGKNLDTPVSFAELLKMVAKIDGLERIRYMTPHPKDLSDELIKVMAESDKICKHIHLPLQSGSTRILKAMNRHYTKEQYLALVDRIREAMPDVSITTDIIVGFPGEDDNDLEETLDVVRKAGFDSAFTFQYSKRTGTPAAAMDGQVSEEDMTRRFNRLLEVVQKTAAARIARYEGRIEPVLVEEVNRQDKSMVTGRLDNNTVVHFKGEESLIGKLVDVRLDECKGFYYIGTAAQLQEYMK